MTYSERELEFTFAKNDFLVTNGSGIEKYTGQIVYKASAEIARVGGRSWRSSESFKVTDIATWLSVAGAVLKKIFVSGAMRKSWWPFFSRRPQNY